MAFVPIPQTVEVVLTLQNSTTGQNYVNVFHYKIVGPGSVSHQDLVDAAELIATQYWGAIRQALGSAMKLLQVVARDISVLSGEAYTSTTNSGASGTQNNDLAPGNTAMAVSWRTAATGRRNRGRTYVGGMTEPDISGDRVFGSTLSAIINAALVLLNNAPNGNLRFAIRSIKDIASKYVTAAVIETVLDSMRRRLAKRGT